MSKNIQSKLRKEILANSHLNSVKESARKYFVQSGINFSSLTSADFDKLQQFIQFEIDKLLADPEYRMIKELRVKAKIKRGKDYLSIRIAGSYFSDREGISFNTNYTASNSRALFIGFCAEMSGCNQTPFIMGFIKWVDYLEEASDE